MCVLVVVARRVGRYYGVYSHSSTTFKELSPLLLLIIMIIFQAAVPTMVIAFKSRGPHQLPPTFIPANKNVSSTTRKPQAKETKSINLNFKCGQTMLVILQAPCRLPHPPCTHCTVHYFPPERLPRAQRGPRVWEWEG